PRVHPYHGRVLPLYYTGIDRVPAGTLSIITGRCRFGKQFLKKRAEKNKIFLVSFFSRTR
ncbi:hypothetical protein, partial [uncultured Dubosiella sp.]|uniref:hypothetical protein n=1 Tax=uncultured Dubosiella sp. TaxID=1937011 RepID=UPI00259284B4